MSTVITNAIETVDGATNVPVTDVATKAYADGAGIGASQTWQDVKLSRAEDTDYTNSTGKPISVMVSANSTTTGNYSITMLVDGIIADRQTVYSNGAGFRASAKAIVPNGSIYSVAIGTSAVVDVWTELR